VFRAEFHDSFGAVREVRRALPAEHGATPVHDTSAGKGST
jgi:hypothetical protein